MAVIRETAGVVPAKARRRRRRHPASSPQAQMGPAAAVAALRAQRPSGPTLAERQARARLSRGAYEAPTDRLGLKRGYRRGPLTREEMIRGWERSGATGALRDAIEQLRTQFTEERIARAYMTRHAFAPPTSRAPGQGRRHPLTYDNFWNAIGGMPGEQIVAGSDYETALRESLVALSKTGRPAPGMRGLTTPTGALTPEQEEMIRQSNLQAGEITGIAPEDRARLAANAAAGYDEDYNRALEAQLGGMLDPLIRASAPSYGLPSTKMLETALAGITGPGIAVKLPGGYQDPKVLEQAFAISPDDPLAAKWAKELAGFVPGIGYGIYKTGESAYQDIAHGDITAPRTLDWTGQVIKGTIGQFRHPIENAPLVALTAFGLASGGAGLAARGAAGARVAAARGAVGRGGYIPSTASTSRLGGFVSGFTKPYVRRPELGGMPAISTTMPLALGEGSVDVLLSRNPLARQIQKAINRSRQRSLDRFQGRRAGATEDIPEAAASYRNLIADLREKTGINLTAEAKVGREMRAARQVEEDIARAEITRQQRLVKTGADPTGLPAKAGYWIRRALGPAGRRIPGLNAAEHAAIYAVRVLGDEAFDDPAGAIAKLSEAHREWGALAAGGDKSFGNPRAHQAMVSALTLARSVLQNPSARFTDALEATRGLADNTTTIRRRLGLLTEDQIATGQGAPAAVYGGARYVTEGEAATAARPLNQVVEAADREVNRNLRDTERAGAGNLREVRAASQEWRSAHREYGRARKRKDELRPAANEIRRLQDELIQLGERYQDYVGHPLSDPAEMRTLRNLKREIDSRSKELGKRMGTLQHYNDAIEAEIAAYERIGGATSGLARESATRAQMLEELRVAADKAHWESRSLRDAQAEIEQLTGWIRPVRGKAEERPRAHRERPAVGNEDVIRTRIAEVEVQILEAESAGLPTGDLVRQLTVLEDELAETGTVAVAREPEPPITGSMEAPDYPRTATGWEQFTPEQVPGAFYARGGERRLPMRVSFPGVGFSRYGRGPTQPRRFDPSIGRTYTGASARQARNRLDPANVVAEQATATMRLNSMVELYRQLWSFGSDRRMSMTDVPVRTGTDVSPELRAAMDAAEQREIGMPKTGAEEIGDEQFVSLYEHLNPGRDMKTGKPTDLMNAEVGTEIEGVRWVPRDIHRAVEAQNLPSPGRDAIQKAFGVINNPARIATLFARGGYIAQLPASMLQLGITQGGRSVKHLMRATWKGQTHFGRPLYAKLLNAAGEGRILATGAHGRGLGARASKGLANMWHVVVDRQVRVASILAEAERMGYKSKEELTRLFESNHPQVRKDRMEVVRRGRKAVTEFENLRPVEKDYLRHFVYFYPWLSRGSLWVGRTAVENPVKTAILAQLGVQGSVELEEVLGTRPDWAREAGLFPTPGGLVDPSSIMPFTTPLDLGRSALGFGANLAQALGAPISEETVKALHGGERGQAADILTPAILALTGAVQGKPVGKPLLESMPFYTAGQRAGWWGDQLAGPDAPVEDRPLYPNESWKTAAGPFGLGTLYPKPWDPEVLAYKGKQQELENLSPARRTLRRHWDYRGTFLSTALSSGAVTANGTKAVSDSIMLRAKISAARAGLHERLGIKFDDPLPIKEKIRAELVVYENNGLITKKVREDWLKDVAGLSDWAAGNWYDHFITHGVWEYSQTALRNVIAQMKKQGTTVEGYKDYYIPMGH